MSQRRHAIAAVLFVLSAHPALAQGAVTPPPSVTAGWQDGFYIQSQDGDYRVQIGGLLHADGRFALADDAEIVNDTFLIRRLRLPIRGRLTRHFEFTLNPDFAGGTLVLQDAYLDTVFSPAFRVRVGKAKAPIGMERLQSVQAIVFGERAHPTSLVANRDVGIQVLGDLGGGVGSYQAGVFNGAADGGSADVDAADSKDVAARVVLRPFRNDTASAFRALSVSLGASAGGQSGVLPLPVLRTSLLQQIYFLYAVANGVMADGVRYRYTPAASYYYKGFGGSAEYAHSEMPVRKGAAAADVGDDAWAVSASWVLTGETAADNTLVRPRANFDFGAGHYGAFQVAARYHQLTVDREAFSLELAAAGASRKAESWTVGLNWYPAPFLKYVIDFERTVFDDNGVGARPPENALFFRTQLFF
jgi:phosphate-selective porin OprO/OprP